MRILAHGVSAGVSVGEEAVLVLNAKTGSRGTVGTRRAVYPTRSTPHGKRPCHSCVRPLRAVGPF
jgi:hypothetical protein